MAFLGREVFDSPEWLAPPSILSRIGPPSGATSVSARQATILNLLLDPRRLARIEGSSAFGGQGGYSPVEYLNDLRRVVWGTGSPASQLDAGRRAVQRVYLERLAALLNPPATSVAAGAAASLPSPFLAIPNVSRSDVPAIVRSQLKSIRDGARISALVAGEGTIARAHWLDVVDRIETILDPDKRSP